MVACYLSYWNCFQLNYFGTIAGWIQTTMPIAYHLHDYCNNVHSYKHCEVKVDIVMSSNKCFGQHFTKRYCVDTNFISHIMNVQYEYINLNINFTSRCCNVSNDHSTALWIKMLCLAVTSLEFWQIDVRGFGRPVNRIDTNHLGRWHIYGSVIFVQRHHLEKKVAVQITVKSQHEQV